jgi:hypothetical protein
VSRLNFKKKLTIAPHTKIYRLKAMTTYVDDLIVDLKKLPSFNDMRKNATCANTFFSDFSSLIKSYQSKTKITNHIEKTFYKISSSNKSWEKKLDLLLNLLVQQKYQELADIFVGLFDICDKQFNEDIKRYPTLNISLKSPSKSTGFKLFFDRNEFFFKPDDFEKFKEIVNEVSNVEVQDNSKYSKREIIYFIVIYLDNLNWRNKQTWLDCLRINLEHILS